MGQSQHLPHHKLLVAQDGAGSANGSHAQIWVVLGLADHESDSVKGSPGILIDGSPLVGGGRFPMAGFLLHDYQYTFAFWPLAPRP